jgi:hypothetical protein
MAAAPKRAARVKNCMISGLEFVGVFGWNELV